ncbi:70 kDa peptidyl-prolyl isomerase [Dionaea muscipula]
MNDDNYDNVAKTDMYFDKSLKIYVPFIAKKKIEAAGKKKEEGNALFKAGKYTRASKRYEKAAKYIEYDTSFGDEEKKQSKALKVTCNLNNVAFQLKLKEYKQAEKLCTKVLEQDSRNVKALYRRAQAYIEQADLELAEYDIKKALEIDPNNRFVELVGKFLCFYLGVTWLVCVGREVKLEYKVLKDRVKEYNKKDAKFYSNMFSKYSKSEPHHTNVSGLILMYKFPIPLLAGE